MNADTFISKSAVPCKDLLEIQLMTGCEMCERRLVHSGEIRSGTMVLRAMAPNGVECLGVIIICKECRDELEAV